ncbi:hypothetical protein Tco_0837266, partial [Tanacetum coccineum]
SLEVIADGNVNEVEWVSEVEDADCKLAGVSNMVSGNEDSTPISLTHTTIRKKLSFKTTRVIGYVIVANGNNMVSSNMCSVKWRLQTTKFCADMMLLPSDGYEMVL